VFKSFPSPTVNCRIDYRKDLLHRKPRVIPNDICVHLCSQKRTRNSWCGVSSSGDRPVGDCHGSLCWALVCTTVIVSSAFHLLYIEKKTQNSRSFATWTPTIETTFVMIESAVQRNPLHVGEFQVKIEVQIPVQYVK
jgi:hypothetical protein